MASYETQTGALNTSQNTAIYGGDVDDDDFSKKAPNPKNDVDQGCPPLISTPHAGISFGKTTGEDDSDWIFFVSNG